MWYAFYKKHWTDIQARTHTHRRIYTQAQRTCSIAIRDACGFQIEAKTETKPPFIFLWGRAQIAKRNCYVLDAMKYSPHSLTDSNAKNKEADGSNHRMDFRYISIWAGFSQPHIVHTFANYFTHTEKNCKGFCLSYHISITKYVRNTENRSPEHTSRRMFGPRILRPKYAQDMQQPYVNIRVLNDITK